MSYILEALRKSDAERGRGAVPDLHAQPIPLASDDDEVAAPRGKLWLTIGAAAVILLAAGITWRFMPREAPPVLAAAPAPVQVPTPAPVPVAPPMPSTLPQAAVTAAAGPAAPAASTQRTPSTPAQAVPAAGPAAVAAAAPPSDSARKPAPRARAKQPPTTATATVAKKPALVPQPVERVPLLTELPDELRRQVPAMAIGGSVYSPLPASRMLIVNGQVMREGSPVAGDVQLEQIGSKAAVFSIRGQRFEVPL
jgi:general secretion pathway protein B